MATPRALRFAAWGVAAAALALVFAWYLQPQFVIEIATRVVACF